MATSDQGALTLVPGVGKKTAERLMVEMRDVLREWRPDLALATGEAPSPDIAEVSRNRLVQDAESALIALGYKPPEAARDRQSPPARRWSGGRAASRQAGAGDQCRTAEAGLAARWQSRTAAPHPARAKAASCRRSSPPGR